MMNNVNGEKIDISLAYISVLMGRIGVMDMCKLFGLFRKIY
jgi:hypothetical protein